MMNRFATVAVLSTIAAFAATSAVNAGFEWVPPGGTGNSAAGSIISVPAAAESAPLLPVMSQELDQPLELPPAAPTAAGNAPAHVIQPTPAPVPVAAPAAPPAQQEPLLKMKTVAAPATPKNEQPKMAAEPVPLLPAEAPAQKDDSISWNATSQKNVVIKPVQARAEIAEPALEREEPAMLEMPPSAPVSRKIVINPYPTKQASKAPAAITESETASMPDTAPASGETFAAVDSFGTDMPLAIGLQQIAPAGYVLAFGDNVNPAVPISWEGNGKPWNEVIQQALAPHQLTSRVEGKRIYIKHLSSANIDQIMPEAGDETPVKKKAEAGKAEGKTEQLALADSSARRSNVTDPGEAPQIQPISTPVQEPAKEEAAVAAEPAAKKITVRGVWEAKAGDSLKNTLDSWSKKANVELNWGATHDYTVASDFSLNDSFEAAVTNIVTTGMKDDKPVVSIDSKAKNGKAGSLTVGDAI